MESLSVQREGVLATVTFNRPERLNALDLSMWTALTRAMRSLSADDEVRCVVLRGAGDKAFAAGADIAEFANERASSRQAAEYGERIHEAMQSVGRCKHPTIAMIKGACIGGGLEIAAMCDLRICGTSSRFGVPINRLGLTMGYGELQGLLAVVGRAVALEILLEGRVFGSQEAYDKGLVTRVVADDEVERESLAAAERVAAGAPLVARWHKDFVEKLTLEADLAPEEWNRGFACYDTEDYREGVEAFLAKRKPRFSGR